MAPSAGGRREDAARWQSRGLNALGWSLRRAPWAFGLVAVLLGVALLTPNRRQGTASAASSSTPGQLTIVGKNGKPAGLCPLQHTDVTADISGFVARVQVTQEFRNPATTPVEAVYTFPLPEDAAVDEMTMRVGERMIRGVVRRREEAEELYQAAREQGKTAALLDQERPNIFTQSVANIMPGEGVTIVIGYVNLLKYEAGRYEFVYPMVVGPRYVGGSGGDSPGRRGVAGAPEGDGHEPAPGGVGRRRAPEAVVVDAERITPPVAPLGTRAGHDISVTVNLDAGLPVQGVEAPQHEVETRSDGPARRVIRLVDQATIPNRDFILRYRVAGDRIQAGVLADAEGDGGGHFALILQPPAAPDAGEVAPKEMVFVIDQTGSQAGEPIEKAKETMGYCVRQLNPRDTFQLLGFNTLLNPCFKAPVHNTPENIRKALNFLAPLKGEGGTDILQAVDYALRLPDDPERLRIVCYMTDGFVGNDMQILDFIRKHRGRARMFPFGIGSSVNRFLIEGMAKEGRGAAEIVTLSEPGREVAARFYRRVSQPLLLDPRVEWNGLPVADVLPDPIPDLFSQRPIILKGRYTQPASGTITVRGRVGGREWSQEVPVTFPAGPHHASGIPALWAREKIEALQSRDWMGAQRGRPAQAIQDEIVGLAVDYHLMSQWTSFVAVEEKVVNAGGQARRIDVPVEMPEGVTMGGARGEAEVELGDAGLSLMNGMNGKGKRAARSSGSSVGDADIRFNGDASTLDSTEMGLPAIRAGSPMAGEKAQLGPMSTAKPVSRAPSAGPALAPADPAPAPGWGGRPARTLASGRDFDGHTSVDQESVRSAGQGLRTAPVDKLAPALQALLRPAPSPGLPAAPKVENGRVEVQVWLDSLPPGGLKRLEAAGFEVTAALREGKVYLGTVAVDRLLALARLDFVRRINLPQFR